MDFLEILEIRSYFNAKVQDCRFQLDQNTLRPAPLESCQKVTHGQPPDENAERFL